MIKFMKIKNFLPFALLFLVIAFPLLSFADTSTSATTLLCSLKSNPVLGDVLNYGTCIITKSVVPLLFSLALAMFIWGVVQYVINNDEEAKKDKGKQFMIWGLIALAIMVSVWGVVSILGNTFGLGKNVIIPQVQNIAAPGK